MIVWIILGVIALLIAAILCVRVRLIVTYADGGVRLRVRVLGIPFTVMPKKEKPLKLRNYSPRALEKRRRKQEKKQAKKDKKSREKQQKKETEKRSELLEKAADKQKKSLGDIVEQIRFLTELITSSLGRFFRHLHTDVYELAVTVATGDPSTTAVTYGAVCAAADTLLNTLQKTRVFRIRRKNAVRIGADFLAPSTDASIRIVLSVRPFRIVGIALRALWKYLMRQVKKGT